MGTGFAIAAVLFVQEDLSVGGDSTEDNFVVIFSVFEEVILSLGTVCRPFGVAVEFKINLEVYGELKQTNLTNSMAGDQK